MRPTFDASLIAHLKSRVIEHNEAYPNAKTKLGDLRKVYERGFRRGNPGVRALQKVDQHLDALAKGWFSEDDHPREDSGEFTSKNKVVSVAQHRARQSSDAGYRAITSDVVPENRHEATGEIIRDGVSAAASVGALSAVALHKPGGYLGRKVGGGIGEFVGNRFSAATGQSARHAGEVGVDGLGVAARRALNVWPGSRRQRNTYKAATFGLASLAGAMAIRSKWKDSFLDPAGLGRVLDAYSYRTVEKMAGSAELGIARIELTQALAKRAGPAGGSVDGLKDWLEQGGGNMLDVSELAKGVPWGTAAIRLFSAVSGLGGATAGSALGYGAARLTETPAHDGEGFETKHPRDDHGRFSVKANTGRAHRFAQVGGLLGGAAAAIATHRALSRYNQRSNLANYAHQREARHAAIKQAENYGGGDARRAHVSTMKRIAEMTSETSKHPAFRDHREALAAAKAMTPSSPTATEAKVRKAFHEQMAGAFAAHPDMEIPNKNDKTGKGWISLSQAAAGEKRQRDGSAAKVEMQAALSRIHTHAESSDVWKEMLDRNVTAGHIKPAQAELFNDSRKAMYAAVASVEGNMAGHTKALREADTAFRDAKKVATDAKSHWDTATTAFKLQAATADDAGKATLTAAVDAADATHKAASLVADAAEKHAKDLRENPVGVLHPIHQTPILPPTSAEVDVERSRLIDQLTDAAEKKATKIVTTENAAIRDRQVRRLNGAFDRKELRTAFTMSRTGIPNQGQAAVKHLTNLAETAKGTAKKLADAELLHAPNQRDRDLLIAVSKTSKKKDGAVSFVNPANHKLTPAEADALRNRKAEIEAAFAKTKTAVDAAEVAHVDAVTNRNGALAAFNDAMKELPPEPARHLISPALRADVNRMIGEISEHTGAFARSPTGANLKALYEGITSDAVTHGKAAVQHSKEASGKILRDFFTRDDPGSAKGWRIDYSKVLPALTVGGSALSLAREDLVTHAQRLFGSDETSARAHQRKLNINQQRVVLNPLTGQGYWTLHMKDSDNPSDKIVLAGNTFEDGRGQTNSLTSGSSLSALKSAIADREERRKQQQKSGQGNGGQAQVHGGSSMPGMNDDDRKAAQKAVNILVNKKAVEAIPTFEGGPSILHRASKEKYKPEGEDAAAMQTGDNAVNKTLRDKHGLKDTAPTGEAYHSALSALFSGEAALQPRNRKYMYLAGHTENGEAVTNGASILKSDAGYRGSSTEALKALSSEIDRVTTSNPPKTPGQANNLARAIGLVAKVKGLDATDVAPLYAKVKAAVAGGAAPAQPQAPVASTSTEMAAPTPAPVKSTQPEVDIDKPRPPIKRSKWDPTRAYHDAESVSNGVAKALKIDNPVSAEHLPLAIAGMAAFLHEEGFSERDAVGTIAKVMHRLAADPRYQKRVSDALISSDMKDPGDTIWGWMKGLVGAEVEAKKQRDLGKSAHALDDLEELVKISMGGIGGFLESLHPRAAAGAANGGEFVAEGAGAARAAAAPAHEAGGHGGVSPTARVAGELVEAGTLTGRKLMSGSGSSPNAMPGEGSKHPQAWYNPTRLGNEFGGALGFDAALGAAEYLLPEARVLGTGASLLSRAARVSEQGIRFGAAQATGVVGSMALSEGGEAAGSQAVSLATGKKAQSYQAAESHGMDSMLANTGGNLVGGIVGSGIGRGVGAFAGRAIGGALGSVAGPAGAILGGAALGYAGGKISEGIYDYFAGYDQPAVKRALSRVGAKLQLSR
ncbi:MAG: hypothetical protein ACRYG8_06650 [Janthinobacterium lividum]